VTEAVRKRRCSALQLSKNSFDSIPISVARYLKSESGSVKCSLEVLGAIDEKHGGFDIVFLPQFTKEYFGECRGSRRKQADVKQFVRGWISGGVQPELLIVDPNHCFVERDLIRRSPRFWL
jgi:hypothetical protein